MAEFLTTEASVCLHEPISRLLRIEDLILEYEALEGVFKGFSDSGLGFWLEWILKEIQPRTLIIDRDIEEVEQSLVEMKMGLPKTNACQLLQVELQKFKNHPLVLWVPFNDLNSRMKEIWEHLMPGLPFDQERCDTLCSVHLEPKVADLLRDAQRVCITQELLPQIKIIGD